MNLPGGKKNRLIVFQARSSSQTPSGGPVDIWNPVFTTWARIVSVSGREEYAADQFNPEVTSRISVDWCPEIAAVTALHRIVDDEGKVLDIVSINTGERHLDPVVFNCKERVLVTGSAQ